MRTIQVSTAVFARIWASRLDGEEDEDTILARLLGSKSNPQTAEDGLALTPAAKVRWREDVKSALGNLGGSAHLSAIYEQVRKIRLGHGRSLPTNLEAIVRRELEYNSSDSNVFTGRHDWFRSVEGIGSGEWALRGEGHG